MTEKKDRVASGKDSSQSLLVIEYQHRADAPLPHAPTSFLHCLMFRKDEDLLIFDDIYDLSVGHQNLPWKRLLCL